MIDITELKKWTLEDLKKVRNDIDFIITSKSNNSEVITINLFYDAILKELKNTLHFEDISFSIMKKVKKETYKSLLKAHDFLNQFLDDILNKQSTILEREKLYKLYAKIMIKHYLNNSFIVTTIGILNGYTVFPSLFDVNFPFYIQSGLVRFIFGEIEN
jgi:hypothetical protein